jgi:hypothetical protein
MIPPGLKPGIFMVPERGAEAPLFHPFRGGELPHFKPTEGLNGAPANLQ